MDRFELSSKTRTDFRKGVTKRMRGEGRIPATIYGKGSDSSSIEIDAAELGEILKTPGGRHSLIDLAVDGSADQAHPVLIQDMQRDAITKLVVHVDFHRVSMDEPVNSSLPVRLTGESAGAKLGGILEQVTTALEIKALPGQSPTELTVDVTALEISQSIHVGDLKIPAGVEVLSPTADGIVVTIRPPAVQAAAAATEGEKA